MRTFALFVFLISVFSIESFAQISQDWENGLGDWFASAGTWSLGPEGYDDSQGAATVPGGNYAENVSSHLVSPSFQVPMDHPRLRFWHKYSFAAGDYGQVQVKVPGSEWEPLSLTYVNTSSNAWTYPLVDLSNYAGQTIQIGFYFESNNAGGGSSDVSTGWQIDDISIVTGPYVYNNPERFENGLGDWHASRGTWEVGGENSGYEDSKGAATVLDDGRYHEHVSSHLVSPPFQVPNDNPRLRFWHWYSFSAGDYGQVQVRVQDGEWEPISLTYVNTSSNAWTYPLVDLSTYAGQTIQIGFYFESNNAGGGSSDVSTGWYIDDISIVTGTFVFNNPERFENGLGDWYASRGTWEVGGENSGYEGSKGAATVLDDGRYHEHVSSHLVSPPFQVPTDNPRLRFWHWYNFAAGDHGQVQIKTQEGEWEPISPPYTNTSSNVWTYPLVDLSVYAGQTVQVGFYFESNNAGGGSSDVSTGWYIDDVLLLPDDCICPAIYDPVCGSNGTTYNNSCEALCDGITEYTSGECPPDKDCPDLNLNIGDPCDDENPATSNDLVQNDCTCQGICPNLNLKIGDPCDDGDASTTNDNVNENCECKGTRDASFYAGMVEGNAGQTVRLPIIMENLDFLSALSGTIIFDNPAILEVLGVQAGAIEPVFNPANNSLSYFASNGIGTALNLAVDTLFWVELKLVGAPGEMSLVHVPGFEVYGAYSETAYNPRPYQSQDGKVSILDNFTISGYVTTYMDDGIAGVKVELTFGPSGAMNETRAYITEADGFYEFTNIPAGSTCRITPVKDENVRNGLLTAALVPAQRFIIGLPAPQISSPFQIFAGDVNCDLNLSVLDLFLIQRVIVELDDHFSSCRSWEFIPAEEDANMIFQTRYYVAGEMPYQKLMEPIADVEVNFIGVKKGDLLNQATPANILNAIIDVRSDNEWPLEVFEVDKGNIVEMLIRPDMTASISNYQLALGYDVNQLDFLGIEKGSTEPMANATADGTILLSWFNLKGKDQLLEKENPLFTLRFVKKGKQFRKLQLKENRLEAVGFTKDLEKWKIGLLTNTASEYTYRLFQNYPNPFNDHATISFELPKAMKAELRITNGLGQLVKQYAGEYQKGFNSIRIPAEILPGGLYFYTLRAGNYIETKQMLVVE